MTPKTGPDHEQDRLLSAAIAAASRRSLLGAAAAMALAGGAAAAAPGPETVTFEVSPQRVESGRSARVSGSGYPPDRSGAIVLERTGARLADVSTDRKGRFRTRVRIPDGLAAGSYRLIVRVADVSRKVRVDVVAPSPGGPSPVPTGQRAWGIFHPNMPENPEWLAPGDSGQLGRLIQTIGTAPGIVMWYQAWGLDATKTFNPALLAAVRNAGATPMITWEPWNPYDAWDRRFRPTQLLRGEHDAYIRSWAEGLKAYGDPVMIRWGHEANGFWYPWSAQWGAQAGDPPNATQAAQYVRSWQRIRQIFRQVYGGPAANVSWVWCPNVSFTGSTPLDMIYPGADEVDWVGLDGYNWYSSPEEAWRSFDDIFAPSLATLRSLAPGKPVVIGEVASHEDGQQITRKADWIRATFLQDIPARHPQIRAFIWFDEDKERSWAVTKWWPTEAWDPAYQLNRIRSLEAFRDVAASDYWAGAPLAARSRRSGRPRT
ncbi:MAG: glycoside hydrolase family 26 protein [Chloroflexota bacterium]